MSLASRSFILSFAHYAHVSLAFQFFKLTMILLASDLCSDCSLCLECSFCSSMPLPNQPCSSSERNFLAPNLKSPVIPFYHTLCFCILEYITVYKYVLLFVCSLF